MNRFKNDRLKTYILTATILKVLPALLLLTASYALGQSQEVKVPTNLASATVAQGPDQEDSNPSRDCWRASG